MYKIINETLKAYLTTNEGFLDSETEKTIKVIQNYMEIQANAEICYKKYLNALRSLPCNLGHHLELMYNEIEQEPCLDFTKLVDELLTIDETLTREEYENHGFGPDARALRKRWRKLIRKGHKILNQQTKNHINHLKEWSKPRRVYVSSITGEVHNGLYWTIRELGSDILLGVRKDN